MGTRIDMQTQAARLRTFETAHQLSKRRASSQTGKKKGAGNTVEWPHELPTGEALAKAGFFFRPAQDSFDNVQCFLCAAKLDDWEAEDDPVKEHLAHSANCDWARSIAAGRSAQEPDGNAAQDPMSEELVAARIATFTKGAAWPHEGKRGWKCKISKMVAAGWCFDPSEDEDSDAVTCFYCDTGLDGWEQKDDPLEEHKKRAPNCSFFALVERVGGNDGKKTKSKAKGKAARSSTSSNAPRLSLQSQLSTFSEAPSLADIDIVVNENAGADDSIMSTASQATVTGTTKGKKKGGRPKAPAKGAKGRKRADTVESEPDAQPLYPDLSSQITSQPSAEEALAVPLSQAENFDEPAPAPAKKTRKGTRQSKQPLDSSIIETSSFEIAPAKKATRGRKAKAQPEPEPEPEADADADHSEVSAQLQEELERSMSMADEGTPQSQLPTKAKRGVKRTSDGLNKKQTDEDVNAIVIEFPVPPKAAAATKGKRGRKPSKQESQPDVATEAPVDVPMSEPEPEPQQPKPSKGSKAPAKKAAKGRKASSTRSSKATVTTESEQASDQVEDLEQDEREIEAELQRIAHEQAIQTEQDNLAEYEPSPSHAQKHVDEIRHLEEELQAEVNGLDQPGKNLASFVARVAGSPKQQPISPGKENATPSPSGSDKENEPSSAIPAPSTKAPILSPTKTTRIPLAPGTPNRNSPPKRAGALSPSKHLSHLTSTKPWEPVDLEDILTSPQPSPGTLAQKLAHAAGALTTPEKGLTVEEWILFQAEKGEVELRRRCEEMVGTFEREGMKALESLGGIVTG